MVFADLNNKGYVLISNFLNVKELDILKQDYETSTSYNLQVTTTQKCNLPVASDSVLEFLKPKIFHILNQVQLSTDLVVDTVLPIAMYTDTSKLYITWHQDHESYFFLQQNYHYLNFYIVVDKPDEELSGLSVVPFDSLKEKYNNVDKEFIGSGAKTFYTSKSKTLVTCQETDKSWALPINIDDISYTPKLKGGDLLLLRGDTIHKTQDNDTKRIALSIRCTRGNAPIYLSKLKNLSKSKLKYIEQNPIPYQNLLDKIGSNEYILAKDIK